MESWREAAAKGCSPCGQTTDRYYHPDHRSDPVVGTLTMGSGPGGRHKTTDRVEVGGSDVPTKGSGPRGRDHRASFGRGVLEST